METYGVLTEEFLCSSTFCNPMYRDLVHCTEKEKYETHKIATDFIKDYFDHYAKTSSESENESDDSTDSFSGLSKNKKKVLGSERKAVQDIVEMEIFQYIRTPALDTCNKFWSTYEYKFPYLSRFACIVLTSPATSCPSERVFSEAGSQIWTRRNRLSASSIEKIMFLVSNLHEEMNCLKLNDY